MSLFHRRTGRVPESGTQLAWFLAGDAGELPPGYHRLLDSPEVGACIDRIAAVVSSATIYLMRQTPKGAKRETTRLARFVDVTPWELGTRQVWMSWIVAQLLGPGDGNAFVLPRTTGGGARFRSLDPMPGAFARRTETDYRVEWKGRSYFPDEVLHFRLFADPDEPWRGRGYRLKADALARSLLQTSALKERLSSPDYKPPLIVAVDTDSDLADEEARERFRRAYLEDGDKGKPWILPSSLIHVEQVRPLSLTDLAVKDTVELDKRAVAAVFGVPPYLVGVGEFKQSEYNNFIRTVILPLCQGIAQELTAKLLESEDMWFRFNERRLYAYDMKDIVEMDLKLAEHGYLTGDETREDAGRDPLGLTDLTILENYILASMVGQQKKLIQEDDDDEAEE